MIDIFRLIFSTKLSFLFIFFDYVSVSIIEKTAQKATICFLDIDACEI